MMILALPYPEKALWPNGRPHFMTKAREVKKHREWASWATIQARGEEKPVFSPEQRFAITITVHPKPRGPVPDADNVTAAAKAYLDGIAPQLGVNDRQFDAPTVTFAGPRNSQFVIEVKPI